MLELKVKNASIKGNNVLDFNLKKMLVLSLKNGWIEVDK